MEHNTQENLGNRNQKANWKTFFTALRPILRDVMRGATVGEIAAEGSTSSSAAEGWRFFARAAVGWPWLRCCACVSGVVPSKPILSQKSSCASLAPISSALSSGGGGHAARPPQQVVHVL